MDLGGVPYANLAQRKQLVFLERFQRDMYRPKVSRDLDVIYVVQWDNLTLPYHRVCKRRNLLWSAASKDKYYSSGQTQTTSAVAITIWQQAAYL